MLQTSKDWWHYFLLALSVLLLDSFLADQCVNLIYKEQDVLNQAITKGCTKWLQRGSMHTHKNSFCATEELWSLGKQMQICAHPLHSNPILWYNLFSLSPLVVQQSLLNLAILTQEHDISSHISADQGCSPLLNIIISDIVKMWEMK